jgi:hypothetical protein
MEADWEVEIGGGAPVIEALWPGFVDLRRHPERIAEIAEAAAFPPLARLLLALNAAGSPLWTAKCDLWEPVPEETPVDEATQAALACYVDLLPLEGTVFLHWQEAEAFCRDLAQRLAQISLPECRVELVVRQAIAGQAEGFGFTAYLSAAGQNRSSAAEALGAALAAFAGAIPASQPPATAPSKLQLKSVGE